MIGNNNDKIHFFIIYNFQYFLHQPGYIWFLGYHQSSPVQQKQEDGNENKNFSSMWNNADCLKFGSLIDNCEQWAWPENITITREVVHYVQLNAGSKAWLGKNKASDISYKNTNNVISLHEFTSQQKCLKPYSKHTINYAFVFMVT